MERDGSMVRVLPDARRVSEIQWTAAGLFMLTDAGSRDFMGLAEESIPNDPRPMVRRWIIDEAHDVEGYAVDDSGQRAIVVVNDGIYDEVRIVDLASAATSDRVAWRKGVVLYDLSGPQSYHMNWSQDGRCVFASWEHPTHPAEIYEWPADRRWTKINEDKDYGQLVEPIETSYRSFDGLEIHSLYYQKDTKPRPAVVFFHGGPEGQSRGNFIPITHLLTGIGINVLLPNVRGSNGLRAFVFRASTTRR